jgi:hypothetical protein
MKLRIAMLSAACLFLVIGAGLAHAADLDQTVVANVPFDFYVGNQEMPAGTYEVRFDPGSDLILMSDRPRQHQSFLMGTHESNGPSNTSKLVFEHTGSDYYLKGMESYDVELSFRVKQSESNAALKNGSTEVEVAMNR